MSSLLGFLGMAAGGGLGAAGLGTKFGRNLLFGKDPKVKQLPTLTPEQQFLLRQMTEGLGQDNLYGQGLGVLRQYLDPESDVYKSLEAPYLRHFQEQTIPGLAERFAGLGGGRGAAGGALSSSGFAQALGSAGAGLEELLSAQKTGLQGQAANSIFSQYQGALGMKPFGYQEDQGRPGLLGPLLNTGLRAYFGEM